MADVPSQEGTIYFPTVRTKVPCQTYYKIFGDLTNGRIPLVVLHGGPGSGHGYCLPYSQLWSLYGIPVVFYDQIGCASSTHLRDTVGDESFWQPELFLDELDNLLSHFHLNDPNGIGYHLFGHSWGGVLAAIFASHQPPGLRRLVLGGALAQGKLWKDGYWELKKQISLSSQKAIDHAVETHDFTAPEYLSAQKEMTRTFLCRADPFPPAELESNFRNQADDSTVRRTLMGESPWTFEGVLGKMDLIPLLPSINVPTLVFNGEFDTTQDGPTAPFFNHIPKVRWVTLAQASHMPHLDSPALLSKSLALVGGFLEPEVLAKGS